MKRIISFVLGMLIVLGMISVNMPVYATEMVDTSVEKGQEIYQNFLDVTAFIETDETWQDCLETQYGKESGFTRMVLGKAYREKLKDAKQEDFDALSPYEAFVYCESYLTFVNMGDPVGIINASTPESHVYTVTLIWNGNKVDEVKAALTDLIRWQYAYIAENGYPYNLMSGKSYAEESGMVLEDTGNQNEGTVDSDVQEELGLTDEEVKEIEDALTEEEIKEIKEETGHSEEEPEKVETSAEEGSKWWLVIPVVLILGLAFPVMKYVSKKKESTK